MIAEIYGKLSSTGSNLSDRLEDQLTGDTFGALRYIAPEFGIIPVLTTSYFLAENGKRQHLDLTAPTALQVRFWPWLIEVEPDLLLELMEAAAKPCAIIIEVKYGSGLSSDDSQNLSETKTLSCSEGTDTTNQQRDDLAPSRNQLIRQMRSLAKAYPNHRRILVYLTKDILFPQDLFCRVRMRASEDGLAHTELYWLSWHDVPGSLEAKYLSLSPRDKIVVDDLLALFRRKGFERFTRLEWPWLASPHAPKNSSRLYTSTIGAMGALKMPALPTTISDIPSLSLSLVVSQDESHGWKAVTPA